MRLPAGFRIRGPPQYLSHYDSRHAAEARSVRPAADVPIAAGHAN
jgi:hypothetical protein